MAKTQLDTINGTLTPIKTTDYCSRVVMREDASVANWPTTDILVSKPDNTAQSVRFVSGEWIIFRKNDQGGRSFFRKGETVGWLATVSGAATSMTHIEDDQ